MSTRNHFAWQPELIAFRIGAQEFCVDIMSVREIRGWTPATPLPHSPAYVRGVINLRGAVLPIVDLVARLGLALAEPTARHVIIVAQIDGQIVGLLVDAVSDILTVTDDLVQPTPDVASDMAKTFVKRRLAVEDRMISLIALDSVLPGQPKRRGMTWRANRRAKARSPHRWCARRVRILRTRRISAEIAAMLVMPMPASIFAESKAALVYSRLAKRLRALGLRASATIALWFADGERRRSGRRCSPR